MASLDDEFIPAYSEKENPAPQPVAPAQNVLPQNNASQNLDAEFVANDQPSQQSAQQPAASPTNQPSALQSFLRTILPNPSHVPFGLNVASGLLAAPFPNAQRNVLSQLPQVALGQQPNVFNRAGAQIGNIIPSMMLGGESMLGQAAGGAAQGALQAPPGQRMHEAGINALTAIGLTKGLPYLNTLLGSSSIKNTAEAIQKNHDAIMDDAIGGFNDVSQGVAARNVPNVPISANYITRLKKYFPQTEAYKKMINDAKGGNYNALRDLQAGMWEKGTAYKGSDSIAEQNLGDELLEKRDQVNDQIRNHLINTGNPDLAEKLSNSMDKYRNLKEIYYSNPQISKLVDETTRKVPKNLMSVVQEDSKPMNAFRQANPEVGQNINTMNARNSLINLMKGLGWTGAGATGLASAYHYLLPHEAVNTSVIQNQ